MNQYSKLFLFLFLSFFATATFAQSKMQVAKIKQRLMTELKIDDVKADSVINIVQDFYANARMIKSNTELKDEDRKASLQTNRKSEMGRLRTQLTNQQIKQLQEVMQEFREERQHRKGAADSTSVK